MPALPTSIGSMRLVRLAQAGAADHDLTATLAAVAPAHLHERAERAYCVERAGRVGRVQVVFDPHWL